MFFDPFSAPLPAPRQLAFRRKMEVRPDWTGHSGEERDGREDGDIAPVVAEVGDCGSEVGQLVRQVHPVDVIKSYDPHL